LNARIGGSPELGPELLVVFFFIARQAVGLMHSRAMIHSLKRQKVVNGRDGFWILAGDDHFPTTGKISRRVSDVLRQPLHYSGARDFARRVHETGHRKISPTECRRDGPHVRPDGRLPLRIRFLSLKDNAATVRQRLEDVLRRVLVDAHR
jgi:hypothetical protein